MHFVKLFKGGILISSSETSCVSFNKVPCTFQTKKCQTDRTDQGTQYVTQYVTLWIKM